MTPKQIIEAILENHFRSYGMTYELRLVDELTAALQEKQDRINELELTAIGDHQLRVIGNEWCRSMEAYVFNRLGVLEGFNAGFHEAERVYGIKKDS